jgi:hypothetical protein
LEFIIIGIAALLASGLTLFSGFGLGTLLMPVFAIFFPVDVAIGVTAIVHLLNNVLKLILLGRYADKDVVIRFGVTAIIAAFLGAWLLIWITDLPAIYSYELGGSIRSVTPVKLIIGLLMILFALLEMRTSEKKFTFDRKYLPFGGFLSGFFGGLSGHQGALRSAFLIRSGLEKESFIATGVVIACIIDFTRIFVYTSKFEIGFSYDHVSLLITAVLAAFAGVFIGSRLIHKVTMRMVQILVAALLFVIALGLISGII